MWAKSFLANAVLLVVIVALAIVATLTPLGFIGIALACLTIIPIGKIEDALPHVFGTGRGRKAVKS